MLVFFRLLDCFIANFLDNQLFQKFTKSALNERQQSIMEKSNLSIDIDHRVADILSRSQLVSGNVFVI